MATIKPFQGYRPPSDMASSVSSPPYEVMTSVEARDMVQGNPDSFLRVIKPEIDFTPENEPKGDSLHEHGAENLQRYNKVSAICWHGFRDFMIAMYELDSNLRFVTAKATYKNKDDFYIKFPDTAYDNIGSLMNPINFGDACLCDVPNSVSVSANEIKDHPTYRMDPAYWIARKAQVN